MVVVIAIHCIVIEQSVPKIKHTKNTELHVTVITKFAFTMASVM